MVVPEGAGMRPDNAKHRPPGRQRKPLTSRIIVAHVDQRIRLLRKQLGMSQTDLGERIGVRFQQVQKHENGADRVSASTLYEIACALGAPVTFFFEGLPPPATAASADLSPAMRANYAASAEGMRLLDCFARLPARVRGDAVRLLEGVFDSASAASGHLRPSWPNDL
ncbi:Transcriptional regulator, contains XRE-family HTH domain [Rhizobiales bacterium GAS113]|nr:Transcriptional regulator, contains XRE-family HTH domain [Rhizobiales bacterium GAS113]